MASELTKFYTDPESQKLAPTIVVMPGSVFYLQRDPDRTRIISINGDQVAVIDSLEDVRKHLVGL